MYSCVVSLCSEVVYADGFRNLFIRASTSRRNWTTGIPWTPTNTNAETGSERTFLWSLRAQIVCWSYSKENQRVLRDEWNMNKKGFLAAVRFNHILGWNIKQRVTKTLISSLHFSTHEATLILSSFAYVAEEKCWKTEMGSAESHHTSVMGKELENNIKETSMGTVFI